MNTGHVYFLKPMGMLGPIKIGFTSGQSAEYRLNYYSSLSPFPLEMIARVAGNQAHERAIHNHFADCHSHNEWFHPIPRLLQAVEAVKSGSSIEDAVDLSDVRGNVLSNTQRATRAKTGNLRSMDAIGKASKAKHTEAAGT